jgi:hypothetical protein
MDKYNLCFIQNNVKSLWNMSMRSWGPFCGLMDL